MRHEANYYLNLALAFERPTQQIVSRVESLLVILPHFPYHLIPSQACLNTNHGPDFTLLPRASYELCCPCYADPFVFTEDSRKQLGGRLRCLGVIFDQEANKVVGVFKSLVSALSKMLLQYCRQSMDMT